MLSPVTGRSNNFQIKKGENVKTEGTRGKKEENVSRTDADAYARLTLIYERTVLLIKSKSEVNVVIDNLP